ncbi:MAG: adenylate kinase family protein [Candidatus Bathyarchaeota archaeon]|jgi:adenylate kinase
MLGRVILVTGTPCVGKTSVASLLASQFKALYLNLTELALKEDLVMSNDEERNSMIIDENLMRLKIRQIIVANLDRDIVIDGHYAVGVVPREFTTRVIVLRRDPVELRKLMKISGFSGKKLWENLASEILDVCLSIALNTYEESRVCEVDVSSKSVKDVVNEIKSILDRSRECRVGIVDWLGKLERKGLLEEFMRI